MPDNENSWPLRIRFWAGPPNGAYYTISLKSGEPVVESAGVGSQPVAPQAGGSLGMEPDAGEARERHDCE